MTIKIWSFDWVPAAPRAQAMEWLARRLPQIETILKSRAYLVEVYFRAADTFMADALRVPAMRSGAGRPATEPPIARITARPAFQRAFNDQMVRFAAADAARAWA